MQCGEITQGEKLHPTRRKSLEKILKGRDCLGVQTWPRQEIKTPDYPYLVGSYTRRQRQDARIGARLHVCESTAKQAECLQNLSPKQWDDQWRFHEPCVREVPAPLGVSTEQTWLLAGIGCLLFLLFTSLTLRVHSIDLGADVAREIFLYTLKWVTTGLRFTNITPFPIFLAWRQSHASKITKLKVYMFFHSKYILFFPKNYD